MSRLNFSLKNVVGLSLQVELQGVSLVALSFFRDEAAAARLADIVAQHKGILGACVCCAEIGGGPSDEWTTCESDRDMLLDRSSFIAALASLLQFSLKMHGCSFHKIDRV